MKAVTVAGILLIVVGFFAVGKPHRLTDAKPTGEDAGHSLYLNFSPSFPHWL